MTKSVYTAKDRQNYDHRFLHFLNDMVDIAEFPSRDRYLYPLMDTVVFSDFETAIEGTIIDFETPKEDL